MCSLWVVGWFSMYDVGGQRSQRRKWVYCFEDVRAVLFVVALSGYDMTLLEDTTVNRLEESLNLFEQIVNNRWFKEASFVLFLNKLDLFREKIMNTNRHLRNFFPDYKGMQANAQTIFFLTLMSHFLFMFEQVRIVTSIKLPYLFKINFYNEIITLDVSFVHILQLQLIQQMYKPCFK